MPNLPAHCIPCDLVFPSGLYIPDGSANIFAMGNQTQCPTCGGPARIVEGGFGAKGGQLVVESAPSWSQAILARLKNVATQAAQSVPTNDALLEDVRAVSPQLATALEPVAKVRPFWFVLFVIAWLLTRVNLNVNIDVNLNELVAQAVAEAEQSTNPKADAESSLKLEGKLSGAVKVEAGRKAAPTKEKLSKRQRRRQRGRTKTKPHKP